MKGIADDQTHAGERRIKPIDRGLAVLEVVQIDPTSLDAVDAGDDAGGAPVGLLDSPLVEDHALEPTDDVSRLLKVHLCVPGEVDGVPARGDVGQEMPVLARDADHVIDPGVVGKSHFGQLEVSALARVTGHDVVDDQTVVLLGRAAEVAKLVLGAEVRVDLHADAVEVTVDGRGLTPTVQAAGLLDGSGMDGIDPDAREGLPQRWFGQTRQK